MFGPAICEVQEKLDESVLVIQKAHDHFVEGASEMLRSGGQALAIYLNPAKPQVQSKACPALFDCNFANVVLPPASFRCRVER